MARVTITFEGENFEEAMKAVMAAGALTVRPVTEPAPVEEPKPEKKKRRTKVQMEAAAEAEAVASETGVVPEPTPEPSLDLGEAPADSVEEVTHASVVESLKALVDVKGADVAGQVMEEFGGSVRMIEVPKENYAILRAEALKAASA